MGVGGVGGRPGMREPGSLFVRRSRLRGEIPHHRWQKIGGKNVVVGWLVRATDMLTAARFVGTVTIERCGIRASELWFCSRPMTPSVSWIAVLHRRRGNRPDRRGGLLAWIWNFRESARLP